MLNQTSNSKAWLVANVLALLVAGPVMAQNDRVFPIGGSPVSGPITNVTKQGITIKVGGTDQNIPANRISKIMFSGDPPELTRGREFVMDAQYDKAIEEFKKVDVSKIKRDVIIADLAFYRFYSEAQLGLTGQGNRGQAAANLINFVRQHGESWHHFAAARTLGDLAMSEGKFEGAKNFYKQLEKSTATENRIASVYLIGAVDLQMGNLDEALNAFDKVIGARVNSPEEARLQNLAKAGRVAVLGSKGDTEAAISESNALIEALNPSDTELAARIYNARGRAMTKAGQHDAAIRAYLHTHLMFSNTPDAHVESLTALVQLWPQVGKPDRAGQMRQVLQQSYPGWGG